MKLSNSNTIFILGIICLLGFQIVQSNLISASSNILVIDGNGEAIHISHNDQIPKGEWSEIQFRNSPNVIVENLVYTDGTTILVVSSDNTIIRNNTVMNANSYAIFAEFCDTVQIINNTVSTGSNDGIISYQNSNVIVENNSVSDVVKNGIYVQGANTVVSSNYVENIQGSGIYVTGSSDVVVSNNQIFNVDWSPIAADATSMQGTFENNTYNGQPYDEIGDVLSQINSPNHQPSQSNSDANSNQPEDASFLFLNSFAILGILVYHQILSYKRKKNR